MILTRIPALGGSTPAEGRYLGPPERPAISPDRAKILLLPAVGAARLQSHCGCRDEGWAASAYAQLEQAAAVRMVARGCACGRTVGRCRARGAHMQPSTIASSLKSTGTEDARNAFFGPLAGNSDFSILIFWENRCLGSSSGTSKSPETVPESKKTFILNEKVLPVQARDAVPISSYNCSA